MKGYLYLIKSETGKMYLGSTNDLERRLEEHKRKHSNSKFTKHFETIKLVYFEEFENLKEARMKEIGIKKSRFERDEFYKKAGIITKSSEHSSVG